MRPRLSNPMGIGASPMTSLRGSGGESECDGPGFLPPNSCHALLKLVVENRRRNDVHGSCRFVALRVNGCAIDGMVGAFIDLDATPRRGGGLLLKDTAPAFALLCVPAAVEIPHRCPLSAAHGALAGSKAHRTCWRKKLSTNGLGAANLETGIDCITLHSWLLAYGGDPCGSETGFLEPFLQSVTSGDKNALAHTVTWQVSRTADVQDHGTMGANSQ